MNDNRDRTGLVNLFWYRCRVSTFKVPLSGYEAILSIKNAKKRASAYKLYRWMCSRTLYCSTFFAHTKDIQDATGLCEHAIIGARRELTRLGLLYAHLDSGPGGRYDFTILRPDSGLYLDWNAKPWTRYISVPYASALANIYAERWSGTDALVYDAICDWSSRTGSPELTKPQRNWFKAVTKNTLAACEGVLATTGFIRLKRNTLELLHPETSQSMPEKGWDLEPYERTYYFDPGTGARKLFANEALGPDLVELYFRKSLPRPSEWVPGRDAHCPFHDDENPSLSINVENCQWFCHACGIGGNKLVTFEMRLQGTEGVQEAWMAVARKIGFRACPQSRGRVTYRHLYRNASGEPSYFVWRFEDGSASYRRTTDGVVSRAGLGKRKRRLYNLPEVIAAGVVLIVEGEKKADILTELKLLDDAGGLAAVTTSGGADSWRTEFVQHLSGKRVLLLPDADEPGARYCEAVKASLTRAEIEHEVIYFDEYGKDFRAFLQGRTPEELVSEVNSSWLGAVANAPTRL